MPNSLDIGPQCVVCPKSASMAWCAPHLGLITSSERALATHVDIVCEKGFTERTGDVIRAVLVSVLVDVMTPAILHGVVSLDFRPTKKHLGLFTWKQRS